LSFEFCENGGKAVAWEATAKRCTPEFFMSGHADIRMPVRAMKAGTLDFLQKPFRDQDMLDAVLAAISGDRGRKLAAERKANLKARYELLSAREREVMALVTEGLLNKPVAGRLNLSEVMVKMHRKQVMNKMGVQSLANLVRCAAALGLGTFEDRNGQNLARPPVRCST
jgi:FixJ family two-component response regulator